MKYTSAEANKLLRKLHEDLDQILSEEQLGKSFQAAVGEDIESVRPAYDYQATQEKIKQLERKICKVKHSINCFNATTVVPGTDMSIDEVLVYLPLLSARKGRLSSMGQCLAKQRCQTFGSGSNAVIDYRYANYDIDQVRVDCNLVSDEISEIQTALDRVNSTIYMEIDL